MVTQYFPFDKVGAHFKSGFWQFQKWLRTISNNPQDKERKVEILRWNQFKVISSGSKSPISGGTISGLVSPKANSYDFSRYAGAKAYWYHDSTVFLNFKALLAAMACTHGHFNCTHRPREHTPCSVLNSTFRWLIFFHNWSVIWHVWSWCHRSLSNYTTSILKSVVVWKSTLESWCHIFDRLIGFYMNVSPGLLSVECFHRLVSWAHLACHCLIHIISLQWSKLYFLHWISIRLIQV